MQIPDIAHFKSGLYVLLLNNKEFRFFLLGLNSIFSTLSQSEYTIKEKEKDWLARNQNNVSEWSDISTRGH
jgi:hypothetical protein